MCQCTDTGGAGGTTTPGTCAPTLFLDAIVTDGEYLHTRDLAALVSDAPSDLLLVDPATGVVASAGIPSAPLAVSVSPTGQIVAVGYGNHVDGYDAELAPLGGGQIADDVRDLAVADNGYGYAFTVGTGSQDGQAFSVELASGTVTKWEGSESIYENMRVKVHPSGQRMYSVVSNAHSPTGIGIVWNVASGPMGLPYEFYLDGHEICGDLWMAQDGARMYAASGSVFALSSAPADDLTYFGAVADLDLSKEGITHAFHIPSAGRMAWVGARDTLDFGPQPSLAEQDLYGHEIHLHDDVTLDEVDVLDLPCTVEDEDDDATYITRHVFANNAGTELYVVRVSETLGRSAIVTVPIP